MHHYWLYQVSFQNAYVLLKLDVCFFLQSDVNTVSFADETGHVIYSGSDDSLCKVNF